MKKIFLALTFFYFLNGFANRIIWDNPITISDPMSDAEDAKIAMDKNGNAVAIFVQDGRIAAATKLEGDNWTQIEFLSPSLFVAKNPQIVMDENGTASVFYIQDTALKTRNLDLPGSWGLPVELSANAENFEAAITRTGDVAVAWEDAGKIFSSTRLAGEAWQAEPDLLSTTEGANLPSIGIGDDGSVFAAWHNVLSDLDVIFFANKNLSDGIWSVEKVLSEDFSGTRPAAAVDKEGNALIAWFGFEKKDNVFIKVFVQTRMKPKDEPWEEIEAISSEGAYDPNLLDLEVGFDDNQTAIAMWRSSVDGIQFCVKTATKRPLFPCWSKEHNLACNDLALDSDLTVSGSRIALITTMLQGRRNNIKISAAYSNIDSSLENVWFKGKFRRDLKENAFPSIAATVLDNKIYSTLVWTAFDGMHTVIQAANGKADITKPPRDLFVEQILVDHGVFTERQNILTWEESLSNDIEKYFIYRNGLLIGSVDSRTISFIDRNRIEGETVVYAVTAVDDDDEESEKIEVTFS